MSNSFDNMYAPPKADDSVPHTRGGDRSDGLGWALLVAPVVFGLVAGLAPSGATVASVLMLITSAVLAHLDARRWDVPGAGIAGIVLFWFVFYPRYFFHRAKYGAPNRFFLSLLSVVGYFAGAIGLQLITR